MISVTKNVVMYRDQYAGTNIEKTHAAAYDLIGMIRGGPLGDLVFDLNDLLGDVRL